MNAEYRKLAYERTVLLAVSRFLDENLLPSDTEEEPRGKLVCEELPLAVSEVPTEAIEAVAVRLRSLAESRSMAMRRFTMVEQPETYEEEWDRARKEEPQEVSGSAPS